MNDKLSKKTHKYLALRNQWQGSPIMVLYKVICRKNKEIPEGARYRSIISLLLILVLFESTTDVLFICLGNRYDSTFKGIYIPFS